MLTLPPYQPSSLTKMRQVNSLPLIWRAALEAAYVSFVWSERRRTRAQLKHLSSDQLADLGVTPSQAQTECEKWFWRP